jgi:NAD(P)-dependent dehydrogenase (short-subunit alcohol dehydrogenase family)
VVLLDVGRFAGRNAFVTGGASRIGAATARRVNCVAPGFIATPMTQQTGDRLKLSFDDFPRPGRREYP